MRAGLRVFVLAVSGASTGCVRAAHLAPEAPGPVVMAQARIVTPDDVTTTAELADRAERALMEQRWADAARDYDTLFRVDPGGPRAPEFRFDTGLAFEGLQDRARARDAFLDTARRFPDRAEARRSLVRAATLDAYLEDWPALEAIGDELLRRPDLENVDRLLALGARALGRIERGDDARAASDVFDALDLGDQLHYGEHDVLPVALAQARFALGELRRVRSERIKLVPVPPDFLDQLEARCAGLLEAQAAYAQAVRSVDPHWAAMAGYRVGEMYRVLHHDLTAIPPPPTAKTEHQKQAFFAFMHVRYRVLLEKGLRELDQTIALGERTNDSSPWIERAREAKDAMAASLSAEKATLAAMPFTEVDVKAALDNLTERAHRSAPPRASASP